MSIYSQLPNDIIIKIISQVSRDDLRNHKKIFKDVVNDMKVNREKADRLYNKAIANDTLGSDTWLDFMIYYCDRFSAANDRG
tara:strand:+ start:347 stop:592 length:246 start_codon:yes stop_codon:yes gene_type:complete